MDIDAEGYPIEPPDDAPFDPTEIPGFQDGDFLDFPQHLMLDLIPMPVQRHFGRVEESVFNGPMLILDADKEDEIVAALICQRVICEKDEALVSECFE